MVAARAQENCKVPYSERKGYTYSWNIDPLDGTKEFIKRNGQFATNIALVRGQAPVVGVVQVPCTGDTYWAVKGRGAFVRKPAEGDTDRRLECEAFQDRTQKGLTIIVSRRHRSAETEAFIAQYDQPTFVELGSSLKFTKIAENEAHIYPRLAPVSHDSPQRHSIRLCGALCTPPLQRANTGTHAHTHTHTERRRRIHSAPPHPLCSSASTLLLRIHSAPPHPLCSSAGPDRFLSLLSSVAPVFLLSLLV